MNIGDVTIIIPVYVTKPEGVSWLRECIDSAVSQGDCEIILYNDSSPIPLPSNLSKYYKERIRLYHSTEHKGVSFARNKAASLASRKLLLPLDNDDRLKPGAVGKLVKEYSGIPLYPDIAKFGLENIPHYELLDFHCDLIKKFVGFSSVNVLHEKRMWEEIGGWNENLDFFEDGEYNARLFASYCGKRYPEPLIDYRMHETQRTKVYKTRSRQYAQKILGIIGSYNMACATCGGSRRSQSNFMQQSNSLMTGNGVQRSNETVEINVQNASVNLPLSFQGKVLAQYVGGKGRGKHYYQGRVSKERYHVTYGDYLYANPVDVRNDSDKENPSLLVRVESSLFQATTQSSPAPGASSLESSPDIPRRKPRETGGEKSPVLTEVTVSDDVEILEEIPDLSTMTVSEVMDLLMDADTAKELLAQEKKGKNRKRVVQYLTELVNG